MTSSPLSRSAHVRESAGRQIRRYRAARTHSAADQRQLLAAQVAQLRSDVADLLAELDTNQAANAEVQRHYLDVSTAALRDGVAGCLADLAATRQADAAERRQQRSQALGALRHDMAGYLGDLRAERLAAAESRGADLRAEHAARARDVAELLAELRAARPAARPPAQKRQAPPPAVGGLSQLLSQSGLVAYAQMARVTILRALEGGAPSAADERQIGVQVDGLVGNLQPFLVEVPHAARGATASEREQLGEIVAGVQRNIDALSHELQAAPWPTAPGQRESFNQLVAGLQRQLAPLHNDLEAAALALQGGERSRSRRPPAAEPPAEPPPARSYRDNLTTIHGIGPALQQRLDRAGICTYIQLALSSPEELRKAVGDAGRLANVEDWIVQARSLAGMPG